VDGEALKIDSEDDVITVRRSIRELARKQGFDAFATAAITTATSELTRNVVVHAGSGRVQIEELHDGRRAGLRLVFSDCGPGIPDLARAMSGGASTARSLGLGLSGSKRLVDEFDIQTEVGKGTRITVTKWTRF
jgi:serine/threonine-protein kinase RsbT